MIKSKLAIITYDNPHRKTQDLVTQLLLHGYQNITLLVIPWISRKTFVPIYKHRPSYKAAVSIDKMCENLRIGKVRLDISELKTHIQQSTYDHTLIGGAGLLPDDLATDCNIINAHPGYLPKVRGLDSLKWALLEGLPLGATTHYITDKADEGRLIEKRLVPLYYEDTFHSIAYRVYEVEIAMMVNAIKLIESKEAPLSDLADDKYIAHRRMPHHLERKMMEAFERLRFASPSIKEIV